MILQDATDEVNFPNNVKDKFTVPVKTTPFE